MQPNTAEHAPTLLESTELRRQVLLDWKTEIDLKRQEWHRLLSEADEQIASIDILLQGLRSEPSDYKALARIERPSSGDRLVSGKATVEDIRHCSTQKECIRVIAEMNNGKVYLGSASKLIEAAGKGKKARTVESTMHNVLSMSDEWEQVEPNTFRIVDSTYVYR